MLPPLFPWLMRDFSLSYTEAGVLMTVFFVVSGVGQALAGFVVDRVGARPVLFMGIGLLAVSGIALGLSTSYSMLVMTAALAGLGNSIFHPADFTLLNHRVAHSRLGHAFSVHGLSGNLGWATAPVFMAGIASVAGWHAAGFAASAVGFIVLGTLVCAAPGRWPTAPPRSESVRMRAEPREAHSWRSCNPAQCGSASRSSS